MSQTKSNFRLLIESTVFLYWEVIRDSLKALKRHFRAPLFVVVCLALSSLVIPLISRLGFPGRFVLGLLFCWLVACFLIGVRSAVRDDRFKFRDYWSGAGELFIPTLNVLFLLSLLYWISELALKNIQNQFIHMAFLGLVAVLFNPLLETIMFRTGGGFDAFSESVEFLREHLIEWFLPQMLCVALLAGLNLSVFQQYVLILLTANPVSALQSILGAMSSWWVLLHAGLYVLGGLYIVFVVLVFRGFLFLKLISSSRRSRIYKYQQR